MASQSRISILNISRGEFVMTGEEGFIRLTKKLSVINKFWTMLGYENIMIHNILLNYKSRCSFQSRGTFHISILDKRMEEIEDQVVGNTTFDVKEWVKIKWSYPCWFYYKDFQSKMDSLIEILWTVEESNVIPNVSLGAYTLSIEYALSNNISKDISKPNWIKMMSCQEPPTKIHTVIPTRLSNKPFDSSRYIHNTNRSESHSSRFVTQTADGRETNEMEQPQSSTDNAMNAKLRLIEKVLKSSRVRETGGC